MKKLLLITLLLALLISCEDTKNSKTNTFENSFEKQIDAIELSKLVESKPIKSKIKLTEANAVSFLTAYGKENLENKVRVTSPYGIIDIELLKLYNRIDGLGYKLKLSGSAKDYIADKGFDKKYGARPLKRAIQKYIEDSLAEEIINSKLKEGDSISINLDKKTNELIIKITKQKKKKGA